MATSFLSTTTSSAYNPANDLELAALVVDQSVAKDRNYRDLSDLLEVAKHDTPSSSGLVDLDYPSLADPMIGLSSVNELGNVHRVPLPAELNEQFEQMQCNCQMGIMTEISRAWLSIDSRIFVWNYEDGSDLAYFDGLSESVVAAGLVKPRPGIFQPHITGLLCLATPIDVVLLGVSFSKPHQIADTAASDYGEMHLLPEPLFSIPTDNVHIMTIKGSADGRIFMAGKDGNLYEMLYQAEDGWFSRKCRKVNLNSSTMSYLVPSFLNFKSEDDPLVQISIDNSRHQLYTRSEKGTISVYDLGEDGQSAKRIASVSLSTTVSQAMRLIKTSNSKLFQPLVHIAAIESSESTRVNVVAISQAGVRLYFTTNAFHNSYTRPSIVSLMHVRMPPGHSANAAAVSPSNVHAAYYSKGTLVLAAGTLEDDDTLWTISCDAFPFQMLLKETTERTVISGQAWAIDEIPSGGAEEERMVRGPPGRPQPPLVVTQHINTHRRFVILNSQGSYIVNKLRPVDQLEQLLIQQQPDSDQVEAFFNLHKEQACATCLLLATRRGGAMHQGVTELATRAFFLYGGEPEYNYNSAQPASIGPTLGASASYLSAPASPMLYPGGVDSPRGYGTGPSHHPGAASSDIVFSARHNGLCLFVARLLRPMWEAPLVTEVPTGPHAASVYLSCRWTSDEIGFVLNRLLNLKEFMEKNSQFTSPLAAETYAAAQRGQRGQRGDMGMDDQTRRKFQAIAERTETVSLSRLQQFVSRACEALALLNILTDHQFHVIAGMLSKEQQNELRHMNLRQFVVDGKSISNGLITALIHMYMEDQAATDAISHRLRELAPSLYSAEDALCSKGSEKLQLARLARTNPVEREQHLSEALKLFKEIAVHLELPVVCSQFAAVRFYRGIVDLSLTAAAKRDPQELALHFYRNGEPQEDSAGRNAFNERKECYKCITESLQYLLSMSQAHPQAPSVPRSPGPPPPADPDALSNTDAAKYADEVLECALRSPDELVHVSLYEWLLRQGLWERLLGVKSPFLEPYLQHAAHHRPGDVQLFDLLWKYYEKQRNFSAAAKILTKLAERHSDSISLSQRLEYLSRASMCGKSVVGGGGELLHELEEKMDVARLQQQIHDALPANQAEARARLNNDLLDITVLYEQFADRYQLYECKLAIIHSAGHYDPTLVETLWSNIIQSELQVSGSRELNTRMRTLRDKVVSLGRMYAAASEKYFPLAFLIKQLEQLSCELEFANDATGNNLRFVFTCMQEIGISLPRQLEIYDRLYKSKESVWKNLRRPYHILHVIHQLLDAFAEAPAVVPQYERRSFSNKCLDFIAHYLVELHTESSTNPEVRSLSKNFKELQAKLERMLGRM